MGQRAGILLSDIGDAPFIRNGSMDKNTNTPFGEVLT